MIHQILKLYSYDLYSTQLLKAVEKFHHVLENILLLLPLHYSYHRRRRQRIHHRQTGQEPYQLHHSVHLVPIQSDHLEHLVCHLHGYRYHLLDHIQRYLHDLHHLVNLWPMYCHLLIKLMSYRKKMVNLDQNLDQSPQVSWVHAVPTYFQLIQKLLRQRRRFRYLDNQLLLFFHSPKQILKSLHLSPDCYQDYLDHKLSQQDYQLEPSYFLLSCRQPHDR